MEKSSTCRQVLLFFSVGNIQYLHQMKLCGYIGEHIVDVQFVHHYPNGNSHNQGIQRADYRKTKNACRLFHSPTLYLLLLFHFNNQIQFVQLLLVNN